MWPGRCPSSSLADQTAKATGQIGGQIDSVRREIEGTVQAIEGIVATIGEINTIPIAIADVIEQQNSATADIARSVDAAACRTRDVNARFLA
jgi:methyl-accepting chemotaxis protein